MRKLARYEAALRRVLWEIRPYLGQVVVVGGWVPHLYQRYGGFSEWSSQLALTAEVDVLVERTLPPAGRQPVAELLRRAGFVPQPGAGPFAVWTGDVAAGEKVEFLVQHTGTARQQGEVVPIDAQEALGAISLDGVGMMMRFRRRLRVPAGSEDLDVGVPTLGAYVVNKCRSYARRAAVASGVNPKRAKDLLYLRDLMAAGGEVVRRIAGDLAEIAAAEPLELGQARSTLALAVTPHGAMERELHGVARMLVEREMEMSIDAALAEARGRLADLLELIDAALQRRIEPPR
jgi:nucleotidyltransferase-like protein